MIHLIRAICLPFALAATLTAPGCIGQFMASVDPGLAPRDGELVEVAAVGAEQVQFVFRFKVGRDPEPRPAQIQAVEPPKAAPIAPVGPVAPAGRSTRVTPTPVPPAAGADVRIVAVVLTDTRGHALGIIDQNVRREANVYYVTVTSAAVTPDTYEVVCQVRAAVSGYQLEIASAATREVNAWRADPRSFKFAVYGDAERRPYEFNVLDWR